MPDSHLHKLHLVLPLPPSANAYQRVNQATGRPYITKEAREYRDRVAMRALAAGVRGRIETDVEIDVTIYRRRRAGDADNYTKQLFDALQGCVIKDDAQVVDYSVHKRTDPRSPRAEVIVFW